MTTPSNDRSVEASKTSNKMRRRKLDLVVGEILGWPCYEYVRPIGTGVMTTGNATGLADQILTALEALEELK